MPSLTTLTPLPYPDPTDQPFVHLDIQALAEATAEALPVVSPGAPPHRPGRRWHDAGIDWISDGVRWLRVAKGEHVLRDNYGTSTASARPMPAGAVPLTQAFPVVAAVNSAGQVAFAFPETFAAVPIVSLTTVDGTGAGSAPYVPANNLTPTGGIAAVPGMASGTGVRLHVIAIGWVEA